MNLVERLRGYASGRILMNSEEVDALVTEAADLIHLYESDADGVKADVITFHHTGGYEWEPQQWWSMPRAGDLVNLLPHDQRAYVNTNGKALYRVVSAEWLRDGEVRILVEGPING